VDRPLASSNEGEIYFVLGETSPEFGDLHLLFELGAQATVLLRHKSRLGEALE
jgi:hypothetical protein